MALGPRLDLRQSQSLVMTPQLQQAIKLLSLSNLELETYIGEALEANPLLDVGETRREAGEQAGGQSGDRSGDNAAADPAEPQESAADSATADGAALDIDPASLDRDRDTGDGSGDWSAASTGMASLEDLPDIGERAETGHSLADHLNDQLPAAARDSREAIIAARIIGELDEAGYLHDPLEQIAGSLGAPVAEVERALALIQTFEPTGVGARSLGECLALQAKEADRYDPCMARLIDNLDLVAAGDFAKLRRMCDVDDDDFADMLSELRGYDPKPGCAFGGAAETAIIPDILMVPGRTGGWNITLNQASLPRLVVNRPYFIELRDGCTDKQSRNWLNEQLGEASWLIKALDQRQKTILKTAAAIAKHQDGFFREGVSAMKALTLREVAEEIEMHESTVSRVTSNKYLNCPRGTFELKYFFSSGVASAGSDGDASSEAVKARIKALTDAESPTKILSDDKLVDLLNAEGLGIARRTVAKYREAMGIGSSVQRRRAKKLAALS